MRPTAGDWHAIATAAETAVAPFLDGPTAADNKLSQGYDPVTEADRAVERAVRAVIAERFPNDAVLGEEYGSEGGASDRRWVIDPIDGTRAFVAGVPVWMTLVGLEEAGRSVAGLAVQPVTGERYLARGGEAVRHWRGRERRLAARATSPGEAVLMTTDPALLTGASGEAFAAMRDEARLVRYSADAYAVCALAAGHVQVVVECGVQPYDVGAVIPIVEAAGGVMTTWTGGRPEAGGDVVAAASPELHAWALAHLRGAATPPAVTPAH